MNLPEYVRAFRAERAQGKGRTAMLEALTAFFEGRYAAAEKARGTRDGAGRKLRPQFHHRRTRSQ